MITELMKYQSPVVTPPSFAITHKTGSKQQQNNPIIVIYLPSVEGWRRGRYVGVERGVEAFSVHSLDTKQR